MNRIRNAAAATTLRAGVSLLQSILVIALLLVLVAMLFPAPRRVGESARRAQCMNNVRQIAIGLLQYAETYEAFPPAYTVDAEGKPLHSWRTLILPFLDERSLYDQLDLTKPWDDPANAEVYKSRMITAYRCPSDKGPPNHLTYLAVVTPNSCLRRGESVRLADIKDGKSLTLLVTEMDSDHAVPWMSPVDANEASFLAIGLQSKLHHPGGVQFVLVDGAGRFLEAKSSAETRRALISIDGNEFLPDF